MLHRNEFLRYYKKVQSLHYNKWKTSGLLSCKHQTLLYLELLSTNYNHKLLFGSNSYPCFHLSGCPEPSSFWTSSTRTSALLRFVEDGWIGWDRYCILVCLVLSAFQRQTVRKKTNNRNHTANHWSQSLLIDKWESEIVQPVKSAGKWWAPVYDWFSVPFDWLNGRNLSSNWLLEHLCLRFLAAIYARDVRRILWTNHIFVS